MPLDMVIGMQWGDEGKGHITDRLATRADIVARFSGGDNAGHTVTVGDDTYKLHLIPSGIIHQGTLCVLGNGMVINPAILLDEIDQLADRGIDTGPERIRISDRAHLITPAHIALDSQQEIALGGSAIGTTQRGIGPAYTDKTRRRGLRTSLFRATDDLAYALNAHIQETNDTLRHLGAGKSISQDEVLDKFKRYAARLKPYISDTSSLIYEALRGNQMVLGEGAQGTLLDIDHGSYPYVTSSSPTAGGAITGLGIGPPSVRKIVGVAKAFTTRVGGGPFPTELHDEVAVHLRGTGEQPWDEFGTTTGRPRRVGWLDLVILRFAARVNGLTELALTKLDILSGLERIPVCTAYTLEGAPELNFPGDDETLRRCEPVYVELPGWTEDITRCRSIDDLPDNARNYVEFVADNLAAPVRWLSVGPGREDVFEVD